MAAPQRRQPQQYYAVPQSPQNGARHYQPQALPHTQSNSIPQATAGGRNDTAHGVATGAIGGGYGPYSVRRYLPSC